MKRGGDSNGKKNEIYSYFHFRDTRIFYRLNNAKPLNVTIC